MILNESIPGLPTLQQPIMSMEDDDMSDQEVVSFIFIYFLFIYSYIFLFTFKYSNLYDYFIIINWHFRGN